MATPSTLDIEIENGGKKFIRNWVFKNLSFHLGSAEKIAILGPNGSGKSTLLQVLSGYESLSEGAIRYSRSGKDLLREDLFSHIAIAAPYLELIEEYTLNEIVQFHFQFKRPVSGHSTEEIIEIAGLENSSRKVFKYFSSGMKQRTKLALAILSEVDLVLLDEPLSNLDKSGEQWYRQLAEHYLNTKTVAVCSNQNESEYFFCNRDLTISDYQ